METTLWFITVGFVTFSLFTDVSETLAFVPKANGKRPETYQGGETSSFTATIEKWHEHKVSDSGHPPVIVSLCLSVSRTPGTTWIVRTTVDIGDRLPQSLTDIEVTGCPFFDIILPYFRLPSPIHLPW